MWRVLTSNLQELWVRWKGNWRFLQVTNVFLWLALFTVMAIICSPVESWHLTLFVIVAVVISWQTFGYQFGWVAARKKECTEVIKAFYRVNDSAPPDFRVSSEMRDFYNAVMILRNELSDPMWQDPSRTRKIGDTQ